MTCQENHTINRKTANQQQQFGLLLQTKCNASGSRTAFETGDIWTETWKQRTQVDRPRYEKKLFVDMGCIWLLHRIHAVYFDLSELVPFQFTSPKRPLLSLLAGLHFAA